MPGPKPIDAVIFDLGRVLVRVDFNRVITKLSNRLDVDKLDSNRITAHSWCRDFSRGRINAESFFKQARDYVGLDISRQAFQSLWTGIFEPMPGMEEIVTEIARHKKIALLSDTDPWHWNFLLETYPYLKIFKQPALSYQIGELKPHPLCYKWAARAAGFPAERCLFIDDKVENIRGAIEFGMQGWLFESSDILRGQLSRTFPEMHIL